MGQHDTVSRMCIDGKLHIPGQVLPIIDDCLPIRSLQQPSCKAFRLHDRHTVGTDQILHPELRCPDPMIRPNLLQPGIHHLALLHIILADRPVLGSLPALIGDAHRPALHLQLEVQRHILPIQIPVSVHAGTAPVPSVPQNHLHLVLPLCQQLRHIISLIEQPFVISGSPRCQHKLPHPLPVQKRLIQPMAGDV